MALEPGSLASASPRNAATSPDSRCEFRDSPLADGGPALDTDQTIWAFFMMQIL
jgi:hypothetical protein